MTEICCLTWDSSPWHTFADCKHLILPRNPEKHPHTPTWHHFYSHLSCLQRTRFVLPSLCNGRMRFSAFWISICMLVCESMKALEAILGWYKTREQNCALNKQWFGLSGTIKNNFLNLIQQKHFKEQSNKTSMDKNDGTLTENLYAKEFLLRTYHFILLSFIITSVNFKSFQWFCPDM